MDKDKPKKDIEKGSEKIVEKSEDTITFTTIKSPSRNMVGEANEFLIKKEREGINISSRVRNQFIVLYNKIDNLEEAWRELNGY